jgi:membrane associated rhomboid family serine protease
VWYLQLFIHVIGHADWNHLFGNFSFILLVGPILEEKYGSRDLLLMILVTALLTGLLQVTFFQHSLMGASGIVFMLILLSSFTNAKGGIPLTFVLVVVLFLGKEVVSSFGEDNVSQFAHIIGGVMGGIFGFLLEGGQARRRGEKL